jgi:hypothetical protein
LDVASLPVIVVTLTWGSIPQNMISMLSMTISARIGNAQSLTTCYPRRTNFCMKRQLVVSWKRLFCEMEEEIVKHISRKEAPSQLPGSHSLQESPLVPSSRHLRSSTMGAEACESLLKTGCPGSRSARIAGNDSHYPDSGYGGDTDNESMVE